MLRTSNGGMERRDPGVPPEAVHPGIEEAFALGERPPGILFYQQKQVFYLPYHLLQSMAYTPERLALEFGGESVVIVGRGLHPLLFHLARQAVVRVVEQGEMAISGATHVASIRRVPRVPAGGEPGAPE